MECKEGKTYSLLAVLTLKLGYETMEMSLTSFVIETDQLFSSQAHLVRLAIKLHEGLKGRDIMAKFVK